MKITLNAETGNLVVSIMRITGGSISKTVKEALTMYLEKLQQQQQKYHYDLPNQKNLTVYQVTKKKVKLETPILLNGKVVYRVEKLTATFLDQETGEIFTEKEARALGHSVFDYGIMILQKEYILSTLRKEPRKFANFVLQFRNKRRGLTPGIDKLCKWYAIYTGKRSDNVSRYVKNLVEAGILVGNNQDTLMPLFQDYDKSAKSIDVKSELFTAMVKFDLILFKSKEVTHFSEA